MNISNFTLQGNETIITQTIISPLSVFVFGICIFITALVLHEIGHWLVLQTTYKNTTVQFGRNDKNKLSFWTGTKEQYSNLKSEEITPVLIAGISLGFVPIIISGFIHSIFFVLLAPYIMGIIKDCEFLIKINKEDDKSEKRK